jgi:hypothetical protein
MRGVDVIQNDESSDNVLAMSKDVRRSYSEISFVLFENQFQHLASSI